MKSFAIALMICLVPAASSFAQSQHEKDREKRQPPPPQQEPKRPDQPIDRERQPDRDRPSQDREKQDREKQDRERQDKDRQERDKQERDRQNRERREPNRVQQGQTQSRDRQSGQQTGHGRRRIPDDRFRANFGREHRFHVRPQGGGEVQRGEGQRFQYAGYWFEFVEPWPAAWSYDDDCYIDYIDDDYYVFDEFHPGYRVLIIVVE
jgi:outer membrane biosynthesis protein TonB